MASGADQKWLDVRDVVRIDVRGDGKWRPAVVVRAAGLPQLIDILGEDSSNSLGTARLYVGVLCGTSTRRDHYEHVVVRPQSQAGKALGLTGDTYFYATEIYMADRSRLQATGKRCPPLLFAELLVLAHKAVIHWLEPLVKTAKSE